MSDFCEANPLSNNDIFALADKYRKLFGIENSMYINIIDILERKLCELFPEYSLEIVSKKEMPNLHGLTIPNNNEIKIREDVYEGAINGNGRDRFTIAHEIFHFLYHRDKHIVNCVGFARTERKIPTYMDPEWQADAFAGAFLMDRKLIKNLSIKEIMKLCGVSKAAAKTQKSKIEKMDKKSLYKKNQTIMFG